MICLGPLLVLYQPGSLSRISTEKKTPPVHLKTVDLYLEMSSDFNYNFCFVVQEIFELGNTTKS